MRILTNYEVKELEDEFHWISENRLHHMRDRLKEIYDILENSYHSNRAFKLTLINGGVK